MRNANLALLKWWSFAFQNQVFRPGCFGLAEPLGSAARPNFDAHLLPFANDIEADVGGLFLRPAAIGGDRFFILSDNNHSLASTNQVPDILQRCIIPREVVKAANKSRPYMANDAFRAMRAEKVLPIDVDPPMSEFGLNINPAHVKIERLQNSLIHSEGLETNWSHILDSNDIYLRQRNWLIEATHFNSGNLELIRSSNKDLSSTVNAAVDMQIHAINTMHRGRYLAYWKSVSRFGNAYGRKPGKFYTERYVALINSLCADLVDQHKAEPSGSAIAPNIAQQKLSWQCGPWAGLSPWWFKNKAHPYNLIHWGRNVRYSLTIDGSLHPLIAELRRGLQETIDLKLGLLEQLPGVSSNQVGPSEYFKSKSPLPKLTTDSDIIAIALRFWLYGLISPGMSGRKRPLLKVSSSSTDALSLFFNISASSPTTDLAKLRPITHPITVFSLQQWKHISTADLLAVQRQNDVSKPPPEGIIYQLPAYIARDLKILAEALDIDTGILATAAIFNLAELVWAALLGISSQVMRLNNTLISAIPEKASKLAAAFPLMYARVSDHSVNNDWKDVQSAMARYLRCDLWGPLKIPYPRVFLQTFFELYYFIGADGLTKPSNDNETRLKTARKFNASLRPYLMRGIVSDASLIEEADDTIRQVADPPDLSMGAAEIDSYLAGQNHQWDNVQRFLLINELLLYNESYLSEELPWRMLLELAVFEGVRYVSVLEAPSQPSSPAFSELQDGFVRPPDNNEEVGVAVAQKLSGESIEMPEFLKRALSTEESPASKPAEAPTPEAVFIKAAALFKPALYPFDMWADEDGNYHQ